MELPESDVQRALVQSYALLIRGLELGEASSRLVLPNGEFFPDIFTGDEASLQKLLDRLLEHAGLSEMAISARFYGTADESCGSGVCGSCGPAQAEPESIERLVDAGEFWQVNVLPAEARQAVALSSALCRAIALAVLREADCPPRLDLDLAIDLTAVALGFGVILLEGSHIYRKSCGGPSIGRVTALGPTELGLVLALHAAVREEPLRQVDKYLSATQRDAFAEAKVWADSNAELWAKLRKDPERVARGEFELKESSSWLGRLFGKTIRRAPSADSASTIEELEAALESAPIRSATERPSPHKPVDPKLEEIRRLVDEALSE
ncbi:MAG TPA: hypothetical protein VGM44_14760 [Polyangiaceae bacterium]|jgi:hypothetical protein